MKTTLQFILDGSAVRRFHTKNVISTETVGHHSHGVAMVTLLLDPQASRSLLMAALFHDLSEHVTGDIPSPAKREYGITSQISDLENKLMFEAGIQFPDLNERDKRTLKLADIAHGALFCVQEMSMGNSQMRAILNTYLSYARQFVLATRESELFNIIEEMANVSK